MTASDATAPQGAQEAREASLERYAVLSHPAGRELQALVDLVAQVCDVPTAAINIITSDRQHQIATAGFDPSVCSRDDSMCALVLSSDEPVVVPDASLDPRFAQNAFVNGEIGQVRFYASAPLVTPENTMLGRLCVFDDVPRDLTQHQQDALMTLAAQIMDVLELRYRTRALEDSLQELTQVRDELRRINELLMQFAGQVSHDLRTPLTAILVNAELLATEPPVRADPEVAQMVESVRTAGLRMDTMIQEMLTFAREGGQAQLTDTEMRSVVEVVLADIAPLVARDQADIQVGPLPRVVGDANLLYSVMLNLVTNAIKFARPGTRPAVSITADRIAEHWRIRVTDNGVGVPEVRRSAMFELFARGSKDTAGHGIGLATARRIVEGLGGTIGMESADGGGTSVWFDLPV